MTIRYGRWHRKLWLYFQFIAHIRYIGLYESVISHALWWSNRVCSTNYELWKEAYFSMTFMVELVAALYGSQEMPHWLVMSLSFQGIITSAQNIRLTAQFHMHMCHMLMVLISHLATYILRVGRKLLGMYCMYQIHFTQATGRKENV